MRKYALMIAVALVGAVAFGSALTANRNTMSKAGSYSEPEVYTNVHIYAGAMVAINTYGYAVPAADATGYRVIGRADEEVNNVGGATAAHRVKVSRGVFNWAAPGVTAADIGKIVYATDDQTVTTSNTSYYIIAGVVREYADSKVWVDTFDRAGDYAAAPASLTVSGNGTIGGTLGVTGVATFTAESVHNLGIDADYITTDAGAGIDSKTAGALLVGAATATSVAIADTTVATTIEGPVTCAESFAVTSNSTFTGTATFTVNPVLSANPGVAPTNAASKGVTLSINGTNYVVALYPN